MAVVGRSESRAACRLTRQLEGDCINDTLKCVTDMEWKLVDCMLVLALEFTHGAYVRVSCPASSIAL